MNTTPCRTRSCEQRTLSRAFALPHFPLFPFELQSDLLHDQFTRPLLTSSSHGNCTCAESSNVHPRNMGHSRTQHVHLSPGGGLSPKSVISFTMVCTAAPQWALHLCLLSIFLPRTSLVLRLCVLPGRDFLLSRLRANCGAHARKFRACVGKSGRLHHHRIIPFLRTASTSPHGASPRTRPSHNSLVQH